MPHREQSLLDIIYGVISRDGEMAYTQDLKSCSFIGVWVRPPLAAHTIQVVRRPLYARIYPIAALAQLVEQLFCK